MDVKHLERLPMLYTRMAAGFRLSIPQLKVRRQQTDLLTYFKIVTGKLEVFTLDLWGHPIKVALPRFTT